jgi:serine/threonine-protein kinase
VDEATAFGRYELIQELASGGMASVWLARTSSEGGFVHVCAVKRVHPHLVKQSEFVDMFLDEARIAARIQHPNVCRVFDFGLVRGTPYLAMEFLAGVSFSSLMSALLKNPGQGRLIAACHLIAEAADGLHAAHELRDARGALLDVVHRDISPQNLFLTLDGTVKVVDFGIASARDKVHETQTGEIKGKFAYMPPEQMRGARVDRRADIWSLGVVLWELCALERLFRRPTQPETMDAVLRAPIAPPSSRRPDVPPLLDGIVARALARDLDERYGSASELARSLESAAREIGGPWSRSALSSWVNAMFPKERARVEALLGLAAMGGQEAESGDRASFTTIRRSAVVLAPEAPEGGREGTPTAPTADAGPDSAVDTAPTVRSGNAAARAAASASRARKLWAGAAVTGLLAGATLVAARAALTTAPLDATTVAAPVASAPPAIEDAARAAMGGRAPESHATETEAAVGAPGASGGTLEGEATPSAEPGRDAETAAASGALAPPRGPAPLARAPHGARAPGRDARGEGAAESPAGAPEPALPSAGRDTGGAGEARAAGASEGRGCIRLGLGVSARIGDERVDGPRTVQVPAGAVVVTLLDAASGATAETRTVEVTPGTACARLVAR